MEVDSHYLFLASSDSQAIHPMNSARDFIVELPNTLQLKGAWECALVDIQLSGVSSSGLSLYICTDLCEETYGANKHQPILRSISVKGRSKSYFIQLTHLAYMRLKRDQVRRLRVFIKEPGTVIDSFVCEHLTCTLHLRKRA